MVVGGVLGGMVTVVMVVVEREGGRAARSLSMVVVRGIMMSWRGCVLWAAVLQAREVPVLEIRYV
jgi:hypothetical protein